MKIFVETERLILRELLPSDLEGMFELDSDPRVHRFLGEKPVKSIEESEKIIAYVREQYEQRGIGRWAAIEKSSGDFIGWSGLKLNTTPLNGKTNFYDIGYRLIPRYWGKGYATESARPALDYGFQTLNLKVIYGAALIDNHASNRILKKLGLTYIENFEFEGETACWYAKERPHPD